MYTALTLVAAFSVGAPALKSKEEPLGKGPGYLGITFSQADEGGMVITEVKPNSPAAQKDVKPGDVIVEVTQEKVKQPQDVKARLLAVRKSGRRSVLLLLSDAKGELRVGAWPTC